MRSILIGCSLGLLLSSTGAAQAASDSAAIHRLSRQFSAAYVRGDAAAMAALYTPDAVIFPERSNAIAGRQAIRRYWTLAPGRRVTRHLVTPQSIEVDGKHAYDHGTFEISGARVREIVGALQGQVCSSLASPA
jgi:ketosteroid isomerase-like protein